MTVEELVEQIVNEHIELLQVSKVLGQTEAYQRGSSFLTAQARLTNCWKTLADSLVTARAEEDVAYNAALQVAEGKDAEARKSAAKANRGYLAAKEKVSLLENNTQYIQSFMRQFDSGFRLMSYMIKGDVGV
jgi:hypothetical protein